MIDVLQISVLIVDLFELPGLFKLGIRKIIGRLIAGDTRDPRFVQTTAQSSTVIKPGDPINYPLYEWYARNDPVSYRICYGVSRDIYENWFAITDKEGEVIEDLDNKAQEFTEEVNLSKLAIEYTFHERWGGYSLVVDWSRFPNITPDQRFEAFGYNTVEITQDLETGNVTNYKVEVDLGDYVRFIDVDPEFTYKIATRTMFDKLKGSPAIQAVFQTLVDFWHVRYSAGQAFARYGTGFPFFSSEESFAPEDLTAINYIIDNFDTITGLKLDNKIKFDFKGLQGQALDPQKYEAVFLNAISAGSFVPKSILTGSEQGAKLTSEIDQDDYFKFLRGEQELLDDSLRSILIGSGILEESNKWKITWLKPEVEDREEEVEEGPDDGSTKKEEDLRGKSENLEESSEDEE